MMRTKISEEQLYEVSNKATQKIQELMKRKGNGAFISSQEILGCLTQELNHLTKQSYEGTMETFEKELWDIALGALFGIASIKVNGLEY